MPAVEALIHRACPVCDAPESAASIWHEANFDPNQLGGFAFASRKVPEYMHYRLLRCGTCALLFASPIPPLESLAIAYREADYDSSVEAQYAAETYAAIVRSLPVTRGSALDIGAGDGAFIELLLRDGFQSVVGVEPSSAPISAASARIRPYLRQELFDPGAFEPESFDLVTCFQTIEHVYNPQELLEGMTRVLRPNGFVLLVMHDQAGLSARLLGRRSPIFDIEHLQLFQERPARFLLKRFGYQDVRIEQVVNRYPVRYWARLFPLPKAIKGPTLAWLAKNPIGDQCVSLRPGNLAVSGRKPA